MTTQAGTEPGAFGGFWDLKEDDLFAARSARGTRGPAVDPRRTNSEKDASIESRVSVEHGLPNRFVIRKLRRVVILSGQSCCPDHFDYLHEHTKRASDFESIRVLRSNFAISSYSGFQAEVGNHPVGVLQTSG
jgi:hypothetical protein